MTATATTGPHVLVYPFPTSGHIIPLLDLTQRLLSRGLTVTILVTPNNRPLLDPLLSTHPESCLRTLVLPAQGSPLNPPKDRLFTLMYGLRELHYPALLDWFKTHPSPPVAILSDFFLGWTHQLASEVGVPRVVFSPSGALALSVAFSLWVDLPKNDEPENNNFKVSFTKIPNCPVYPWFQVSHIYRMYEQGHPDWEFYRSCLLADKASWGFVFNSFTELERVYLDHLKKEMGHNRVWAVGPVLPAFDDMVGSTSRGGSSSVPTHEVLTWLESRPENSVVYVCFGSRQVLTSKQMNALAGALEKTGVNFVWCVRQSNKGHVAGDEGVLSEGFEDRVAGKGYIIKGWAPQVAILRHKAVGAFLTHCGWNSVLEGISAGVVMLTWPQSADQFTNANILVNELKVGIRVGEGTQNIPESTELAHLLTESVDGTRPERMKAKELSGAASYAVSDGGSSDKDLDEFIKSISELKSSKN
ncbi:hypothetical protein LWI29_030076 [Acer saccharum]|uniref:Uncharacterized protein n=1 Tax=Acer saccharum TaxID=4024 RepID=A0AA39S3J8_ACESA|nr:hypothetical protein LWI29_030076 [Acer saccharum]KAK1564517.1 hypothetical protein Q3G72_004949 [Acer saccharum]